MAIRTIELFHLAVPLKTRIKHASHDRTESENLAVRVTLDDGTQGYGEGVPRSYVCHEPKPVEGGVPRGAILVPGVRPPFRARSPSFRGGSRAREVWAGACRNLCRPARDGGQRRAMRSGRPGRSGRLRSPVSGAVLHGDPACRRSRAATQRQAGAGCRCSSARSPRPRNRRNGVRRGRRGFTDSRK